MIIRAAVAVALVFGLFWIVEAGVSTAPEKPSSETKLKSRT